MVFGRRVRPRNAAKASTGTDPFWLVVFAAVLLIMGIVLCVRGLIETRAAANLDRRGALADATVVAVEHDSMAVPLGGMRRWTNVTVTFLDVGGTARRTTQEGRDSTKVGERLRIRYDPQGPSHARWEGSIDPSVLDWWTGAASMVGCLGMLIAAFRSARRRRSA